MSNIFILLKCNLLQIYNKFTKNLTKKKKRSNLGLAAICGALGIAIYAFIVFYIFLFAMLFKEAGRPEGVLITVISVFSMICFMTTLTQANSVLFRMKDYDLLAALPIKKNELLISKIVNIIGLNPIISILLGIPTSIIYGLMNELEDALDKGLPLLIPSYTVVKKDTVTNILDKLYAALPDEIKEARALLRRKDELQYDAQQRAEKIIADAQAEANRLLSESDLLRAVQREAEKIKEQVIAECEENKRKSLEEAEALRNQAIDEALRTKDGASVYAEQVLVNLEQNLNQLQEIVKNGQLQLERRRAESDGQISGNYTNQRPDFTQDFRMN